MPLWLNTLIRQGSPFPATWIRDEIWGVRIQRSYFCFFLVYVFLCFIILSEFSYNFVEFCESCPVSRRILTFNSQTYLMETEEKIVKNESGSTLVRFLYLMLRWRLFLIFKTYMLNHNTCYLFPKCIFKDRSIFLAVGVFLALRHKRSVAFCRPRGRGWIKQTPENTQG